MFERKAETKDPPKRLIGPIAVVAFIFLLTYTTIASAALNSNLQISGEAAFVPDHSFIVTFDYTGSCVEYVIPKSGLYKLEAWGAEGGGSSSRGKGGYSTGKVNFVQGDVLYICVGGAGKANDGEITAGGFNGGGNAYISDGNNGSGGGATDIRIGTNSLYARVVVAGGGGGFVAASGAAAVANNSSHGGGFSGLEGSNNYKANNEDLGYVSTGGTQTSAGMGISGAAGNLISGAFGNGANGGLINRAGGGGGWYGGGSNYIIGGGGSGFAYTASTSAFTNPTYTGGSWLLNSSYYLIDAYTVAGNSTMPSLDGTSTISGKSGHGYAKLSFIPTNDLLGSITYSPMNWTNGNVTASLSASGSVTNNGGSNTYQFTQNGEFNFEFSNGSSSGVAMSKVTWIDKLQPDNFVVHLKSTTVTKITVQGVTTDQGGSGINNYYFSIDNGATWVGSNPSGVYTFTGLTAETSYNIKQKAVDNAGNERISGTLVATTMPTHRTEITTVSCLLANCGQYQQGSSGTDNSSGLVSATEVRATAGTSTFFQDRNWTTTAGYYGSTMKTIVENHLNQNFSGWSSYSSTAKLTLQINIDFNTGNSAGEASCGTWVTGGTENNNNLKSWSGSSSANNGNHNVATGRDIYIWNNAQTPSDFFIRIYVRKAGSWTDARTIRYYPQSGNSYVTFEISVKMPNPA